MSAPPTGRTKFVKAKDIQPGDFLVRYRDTAADVSVSLFRVIVTLTNDGDAIVFRDLYQEVEIL